jgi:hypothetical protein
MGPVNQICQRAKCQYSGLHVDEVLFRPVVKLDIFLFLGKTKSIRNVIAAREDSEFFRGFEM